MIPHRTPFFLPWMFPSLYWRIESASNELFLTFDDGPVPGPTEFVLEELSRNGIKATFFCIGNNVAGHPDIFSKIIEGGHALGNHTYHHRSGWKTSTEQYERDVLACQREFRKHLSPDVVLFRPPYGRITPKQIKSLSRFRIIMWDVLSVDYNRRLSPERCLQNTIQAVRSGSIIVFHDSYKAERNMTFALPRFIEHCLENNYTFKPIVL